MTTAERYRMRIDKGLCPRCGHARDGDAKFCSDCREYYRERRKLFLKRKICPMCGKERIYGDEKECLNCTGKRIKRDQIKRKNNRDKLNEYNKQYYHRIHKERLSLGLCTRCGKKLNDSRYKMCAMCRYKKNISMRERAVNNG